MAFSKITTRGMSGDTLEAGDIAANAIGASELADNAVDTAAIAATSITEAKLNADITDGSAIQTGVKPHIRPGTLYPAVNGMINYDSQHTFTDSSGTPKTITAVGHTHHIGNPKIGTTSIRLDGDDYLTVAAHSDFNFGTSDFCIEFWWKGTFGGNDQFFAFGTSGEYWVFYQEAANKLRVTMGSAGTRQFDTDSSTIWENTGQFVHFAITKTGTSCKLYINGVEETTINGSYTNNPAASIDLSSLTLSIGANPSGSYPLNASNIDEFRISNHIRYSGNFTPSTTAFSNDANTKFLLHSDNGGNSGAYGTAQSDGRSYYYTDIKGSKPIKDPRIGAHFGSQRHKFKSIQRLPSESAENGKEVYSVDGREWIRAMGNDVNWKVTKDSHSSNGMIEHSGASAQGGQFIEVVGYGNMINIVTQGLSSGSNSFSRWDVYVDGELVFDDPAANPCTVDSPLRSRYVDSSMNRPLITSSNAVTLGLHTFKIATAPPWQGNSYNYTTGFELIAQDTSSTANKSKIQIPAQNVVSYGKKYSLSAAAHHYDPFNGFTSGNLAAVQALIDTSTSLGLNNWLSGSTYYRPFQGGRVVKWVDSSGAIKTSVTAIPPNAQNIGNIAVDAHTLGAANDNLLNFDTKAIDHSLSEEAKTFHWREFGNGAAGQGDMTHADATNFLTDGDDIGFVMDDGLTAFTGQDVRYNGRLYHHDTNGIFLTFIGTGISYASPGSTLGLPHGCYVQNLPYGTHILMIKHYASYSATNGEDAKLWIDGTVIEDQLITTHGDTGTPYLGDPEFTIHQPKKPPIPEDAVVLADYMLMADFIAQGTASAGASTRNISKGVRRQNISRDVHYEETDGGSWTFAPLFNATSMGYESYLSDAADSDTTAKFRIPGFGTNFLHLGYQSATRVKINVDDVDKSSVSTKNTEASYSSFSFLNSDLTLGSYKFGANAVTGQNGHSEGFDIVTPIHTSSHYQTFETPHLHELIGGDRNMEQTNLVVTADGKTWDEATRDTSYISNVKAIVINNTQRNGNTDKQVGNKFRGESVGVVAGVKDFSIMKINPSNDPYNHLVCLVEGHYRIEATTHQNTDTSGSHYWRIRVNGVTLVHSYYEDANVTHINAYCTAYLKRGDQVDVEGTKFSGPNYWFAIYKI